MTQGLIARSLLLMFARPIKSTAIVKTEPDRPSSLKRPVIACPDRHQPERRRILAAIGLTASGLTGTLPWAALASSTGTSTSQALEAGSTEMAGLDGAYAGSQALAITLTQKAMEQTGTSSVSMALISRNGLIWARAIGTLGKEQERKQANAQDPDTSAGQPVTTDTLYCIGSCSKLFATVAALQLVDRGLVDLDTPVKQYLPIFAMHSPEYRHITVRMLLNHQSGFPGSDYSNAFTTLPYSAYSTQVVETLSMARLKHAPGEMSVYCNDGFTLIEQVVQAVTGVAYVDYIQRNVLDPLCMTNSRYAVQLFPQGSFAPGRSPSGDAFLECINVYASGGLFTTPTDMAQFARLFLNQGVVDGAGILSGQAIESMAELQALGETLRPVPVEWGFGLGWDNVRERAFASQGMRAWRKNGGTSVYGSDFYVLPDHGLAFMITGTSTGYQPDVIAEQVLFKALLEQGSLTAPPQEVIRTPSASTSASPYAATSQTMPAIYANSQAVFRVCTTADPQTVNVDKWEGKKWARHARWQRGADGLFYDPDAPQTRFGVAHAGNHKYLSLRTSSGAGYAWLDLAFAQAVEPGTAIPDVWQTRIDQTWVVINERYTSLALAWSGPILTLFTIPEIPGHLGVNVAPSTTENQLLVANEPDAARMIFKIPYTMSRDLNDLLVEHHDGMEHLRWGRMLFRALGDIPSLLADTTQVQTIGTNGFSLAFRAPDAIDIELDGAIAAFVYDDTFKSVFPIQFRAHFDGTLTQARGLATMREPTILSLPKAGLVLVYGNPGETVTVRSRSPETALTRTRSPNTQKKHKQATTT
ncbi:hypothetical protein DBV39_06335 [Orrella marina]|uniref:Beta-lactamase-related domain-containing protein n=2 Tax=Orrella marina TaxID=2163011 RepID=A0A2R4XI24_9BURK|nr:hypothetical protein DBV39_06335 [Orrella marina]